MLNQHGENIRETCTRIIDPSFEKKLKRFDKRLLALFDNTIDKWVILELAYDNSKYNVILICEDSEKNAKPLGEWVFNKLFVMHQKWLSRKESKNDYLDELIAEQTKQKEEMEAKADRDHIDMIKDDINEWRKASKELDNLPASDVTAGYAKGRMRNENV